MQTTNTNTNTNTNSNSNSNIVINGKEEIMNNKEIKEKTDDCSLIDNYGLLERPVFSVDPPINYEKYIEEPWAIIESYFSGQYLERLVRHQLESYNNLTNQQLNKTIDMFNPMRIVSDEDLDPKSGLYSLEIIGTFENFNIYRPKIHENNGAIKLMFPQEARLRNFTYASEMTIDINFKYIVRGGENLQNMQIFYKTFQKIHIGKLPIMLKSNNCVLNQYRHVDNVHTGECRMDAGGYFIINGSEKTVLAQERAAENRVYCFNVAKNNTKYTYMAEMKSVPDSKCISPKQISMMVSSKNIGFGFPITLQIPRVKQPVPLFIVFRALGIISDKEICDRILIDIDETQYKTMLECLQASIIEANKCLNQEEAIKIITSYVMYTPINMDKETGANKKHDFAMEVLNNDLFPHCQSRGQKIFMLGYMTNKLLQASLEWIKLDDRDSYINKRIDLTGSLLNNQFRNYFNKTVKDMEKQIIKEIKTGSWRSTDDYENIVNLTNLYKIVKPTTIENGINRALATGDFGIKHNNSNKVGVAQVLNRLTYPSSLSHLRRIATPADKSGKLIPPRKLHNTTWGFICPAETPEGQSVGIVKNLSVMSHITIHSHSNSLYEYITPHVVPIEEMFPVTSHDFVKVFINGTCVGFTYKPFELYSIIKDKKHKGIINIYTSIIFDYKLKEIRVCNDSGRIMRPLLRVKDNNLLITDKIIEDLKNGLLCWNDLFTDCKMNNAVLEYIDPEEQSHSLIATTPKDLISANAELKKYTHCEIHPSTIFGVLASCIPFPEHNQSPRNTYQCAMGKQAMGVYVTNYSERMDKTAYVLNNPTRPLVDTRVMNMIKLNEIPSGCNITVAIMTHTGYNQEDSLLINKGSIDRGLFQATIYHTEKDEDKQKINGDEEIRCKPDPAKTKGMKFGNYNKVTNKGVVPENTLVENRDIIIAKVTPIKDNRNDHTKVIKYEDQSKMYRTNEPTYIDKNYIDRNGHGYNFAKVRVRTVRKPVIGDKFCALPTQQVLTNMGWIEIKDVDIEVHKLATLGLDGGLHYEYPSAKFEYDHDGDMYYVKNKQVHVICTLNHRLYVKGRAKKQYELVEAQKVMGKVVQFKKNMDNLRPDIEFMEIGDKKYKMDDWLQLVGMFVSDGSCDKSSKSMYITALKERKIIFNKSILDNLQISYAYHTDGNYRISGSQHSDIYNEFVKMSLGALNKRLPPYAFDLSQRQSIILLEALLQGDGHTMQYKGEDEFSRYGTISIQLANDVSILAFHCGWSGIIKNAGEPTGVARVGVRNLGSRAGEVISVTQQHTYYKVSIIRAQNMPWINKKVNDSNEEKLINYTGKVYCVEMPSSHTYYMRETMHSPSQIIGNSSRHGQKGTCGNIIPEEDMPFTKDGVRPDIIINPHAIPSRMTIGQLKEMLLGRVLVELGLFGDGTSFGDLNVETISKKLSEIGFESNCNEVMYNGLTGEQLEADIFVGPVFYQRLKHMVSDKQHSRSIGPMVNLTRQPAEGRSRDGGLRFGEMERDCLFAGSPLTLSSGISISIENMESCDFELLGWSEEKNGMVPSKQTGFMNKGIKECFQLTYEDGRKIICTEEHPLLTSNNTWVKAKDLLINEDKIKASVTCPLVNIHEEIIACNGWQLQAGDLTLTTSNPKELLKTFAFIRIIGYLINDGNITYSGNSPVGRISLGHLIDVQSFKRDLALFSTKQNHFMGKNTYYITLSAEFMKNIIQLEGITIGAKINQPAKLPAFILDPLCPAPIVREFLGAIFGADGHTCILGMHRGKRDLLSSVSMSKSSQIENFETLNIMFDNIQLLLNKCGIHKMTVQKFKETTSSKKSIGKPKSYQLTLHLDIEELIPFSEKIGFRYCCHKAQRLEAGVTYRRLRSEVVRQHNWLTNRVDELTNFSKIKAETPDKNVPTKKAILQAVQDLQLIEPLIHDYAIPSTHDINDHLVKGTQFGYFSSKSFPTAEEFFKEIGALDWFITEPEPEQINNTDDHYDDHDHDHDTSIGSEENIKSVTYGVNRTCDGLPTMNLKVIDIRPVGPKPVYDIEVQDTHSFLANGIVAHNCMVSHGASRFTRGRMYDASDKFQVHVCKKCGLIAAYNDEVHIHHCKTCDNKTEFSFVEIPYAYKLLSQELITMNVAMRVITDH
jgi:DNA-directed RNA polymerase II subunit RPB2